LRSAIERIRGQYSATTRDKKLFCTHVLNYMQDHKYISNWESAAEANRYDYEVVFADGRIAAIETKGCLDGNNTNIFERPPQANEFIIWSLCSNPGADPGHNAWSGINARLSAEIISRRQIVDGVVIWDMFCATLQRPCPKTANAPERLTVVANYQVPPPCIYVLPETVPHPRNNPHPVAQTIENVRFLKALHECFGGRDDEVNFVDFDIVHKGASVARRTRIRRGDTVVKESQMRAIRRT
jgi:hypothetical protein